MIATARKYRMTLIFIVAAAGVAAAVQYVYG